MSLPRVFSPLLSTTRRSLATASIKSRYRPSPHSPLPSVCASCLRRSLQTATPYRPETLDIPTMDPAPPRNKDAPKSELTVPAPDGITPPFTSSPMNSIPKAPPAAPSLSTLSGSQTSSQSTSPNTSTSPTPRKLRPRKAALTLTPLAVHHIRSLTQQTPPKLIRVGVKQKGCSGLAYHLEYIEKPGRFDEVVDQDGVKVYINSKALFSIIGSEMDWVEDQLSARFVFNNPNIKEACGCGESFMVHGQGGQVNIPARA
ncbi:Iron-sulfur assembly protein 1 [Orbilia brochopaga]|uniref:Iron-sulfur assembly protein 1 n=1 Tax=Orbilia brochopaga TaxID=3140254 RepID=A0AAV9VE37_9PEZI